MQRDPWNNQTTTGRATEPFAVSKHGELTALHIDQGNPRPWLQRNGKRRPRVGDNMHLAHLAIKEREFSRHSLVKSIQAGEWQGSLSDDNREGLTGKTAKVIVEKRFSAGGWAVSISCRGPSGFAHWLGLNCFSEFSSK